MNQKAAELGCANTHFANPCGLPAEDHYTTARDLATIMRAASTHPEFCEIAGAATWDLPATSGNDARTLENTNLLIDPESPVYMGEGVVTAGKTGFTDNAWPLPGGQREGHGPEPRGRGAGRLPTPTRRASPRTTTTCATCSIGASARGARATSWSRATSWAGWT